MESQAIWADKLTNVCCFLQLNPIICGASVSISLHREVNGWGEKEDGRLGRGGNRCQFAAASRWQVNCVEKCVCVLFYSLLFLFFLPSYFFFHFYLRSSFTLRGLVPTPLTDSEANKPQSRDEMKVNIFMNGFSFFLALFIFC